MTMTTDARVTVGLWLLGLLLALVSLVYWLTIDRMDQQHAATLAQIQSDRAATLRELDNVQSLLRVLVSERHE